MVGQILFTKFQVKNIFCLFSNALPLYAIGLDTGITVDCGFQQVEITPFSQSQVCIEGHQICYAGGVVIEKELSKMMREDN